MQTVTIDGRRITYQHVGQGPPVILAHCSSGFHRMWSTAIAELSTRYRVLAPDLLGYGKSERWRPGDLLEPDDDANVIRGLAFLVGGPVHLVGHSFGGSVVLEAARTLGDQVRSLTLIEPVTFHLLRLARREAEWAEISEVSREMQAAAAKGHLEQAAGIYMSFWIGRLRWWLTPTRAKRAILDTLAKTVAEFGMIERMATSLTDYTRIEAPARLIVGEKTTAPARAVSEVLHAVLPEAHGLTLLGVGHMSPITHAAQVAGLVTAHLDAVTRGASTGKALNVA